ncbi:MAG: UMP kinase [Bacteroidales bacterium]|nr:UMP kinase [Bacteroidales bacterium]
MPDSSPSEGSPAYQRVLLKLSGEAFGDGGKNSGISLSETLDIAHQLKRVVQTGVQLAIVVGGGNILRGAHFSAGLQTIRPATADTMGMLATVLNGLALQDTLETLDIETRLLSAVPMDSVCEPYIRRRAIRHLEKGRVVILAGGTGNPFVTTDTAAALRGRELGVDILMKATRVDGVYDSDPEKNPYAEKYQRLTYMKVLQDRLKVMDLGAFEMCSEARLPILVFNYTRTGAIEDAIRGRPVGTIVAAESPQ